MDVIAIVCNEHTGLSGACCVRILDVDLRRNLEGLHKYCIVHQKRLLYVTDSSGLYKVAATLTPEARRDGRFAAAGTCEACQKLNFAAATTREA
jgi:hypothetical protein